MLITYTPEQLQAAQPNLEKQIRVSAAQRVMSFDEDYEVKKALVEELESLDLNSIFPSVH